MRRAHQREQNQEEFELLRLRSGKHNTKRKKKQSEQIGYRGNGREVSFRNSELQEVVFGECRAQTYGDSGHYCDWHLEIRKGGSGTLPQLNSPEREKFWNDILAQLDVDIQDFMTHAKNFDCLEQ